MNSNASETLKKVFNTSLQSDILMYLTNATPLAEAILFTRLTENVKSMQGVSPIILFNYLISSVVMLRMQNYDLFANRQRLVNVVGLLDTTLNTEDTKKIVNQITAFAISAAARAEKDPIKSKAIDELLSQFASE